MDLISGLPDEILAHVLSFVPPKLAVATSLLSKRWMPLWKSTNTLDLDDSSFEDFDDFQHYLSNRDPRAAI